MEQLELSEKENASKGCMNCGHPIIEAGYPNPLCSDCRQQFIKYPIPLYVKLFAAAIALVMLYSITKLPHNFSTIVHFERGLQSEKRHDFTTARQEFDKALGNIPDLMKAKCHLMIAAYEEMDFRTVYLLSNELNGKEIEDQELLDKMTRAVKGVNSYLPADSFVKIMERYGSVDSIPVQVYMDYIAAFPDETFPRVRLSTLFWEKGSYSISDSMLNDVLRLDKELKTVYSAKAGVKRMLNQYDSAIWYCDQILRMNRQSVLGLSSKARVLLRMKKDKEGLEMALQSQSISNDDPFGLATLALAYHFNNNFSARDQLVRSAATDSTLLPYFVYVQDIIQGKEKFRD